MGEESVGTSGAQNGGLTHMVSSHSINLQDVFAEGHSLVYDEL